ncbi:hypothetical protein GOBAR_DD34661 [Gossypium barbadense]|nr:hypothetical protein GOBAR_DD34661 [Gossypium barbadense]
MANVIEKLSEQQNDMVENRGAMKGKKTRMAKVKLVVSDVLIKVEDTKDSFDEIKSEMSQRRNSWRS